MFGSVYEPVASTARQWLACIGQSRVLQRSEVPWAGDAMKGVYQLHASQRRDFDDVHGFEVGFLQHDHWGLMTGGKGGTDWDGLFLGSDSPWTQFVENVELGRFEPLGIVVGHGSSDAATEGSATAYAAKIDISDAMIRAQFGPEIPVLWLPPHPSSASDFSDIVIDAVHAHVAADSRRHLIPQDGVVLQDGHHNTSASDGLLGGYIAEMAVEICGFTK